jgi:hypothetical protein
MKKLRDEWQALRHQIEFDFLFQHIPIICTSEKRPIQPGNEFEHIIFSVSFEIVKI